MRRVHHQATKRTKTWVLLLVATIGLAAAGPRHRTSTEPAGWDDCVWLPCGDGKWRPIEPGLLPLAYGVPECVGQLRAYGNAIVPQIAATFITAAMEAVHG